MSFSQKVSGIITQKNSCLMLGLDPSWEKIPAHLKTSETLEGRAQIYKDFCLQILDTCEPFICGIKIQMAYFEVLGSVGIKIVEEILEYVKTQYPNRLITMLDAKRNDIGSTSEAYAQAFLGKNSPLEGDSVTVNPFLGTNSLLPFVHYLEKGVFVLFKTSNPSAPLEQTLISEPILETFNGAEKFGNVGVVFGATKSEEILDFRSKFPYIWILAPGVGAQGGDLQQILKARNSERHGVLVPVSRSVLYAGQDQNFAKKSQEEIQKLWEQQKVST